MSIKDPSVRAATLEEKAALEDHIRLTYDTDLDTYTRRNNIIRVGARPCRMKYSRGAIQFNYYNLADAEEQLACYKTEGYNTVVIDDVTGYANGEWTRITEDQIKAALDLARSLELGVIVYMYFSADAGLGVAAATTDAIKERIQLYASYDEGEVLGVTGMYGDNFLVGSTIEEQKRWYDAVKEVTTSYAVYGIFGLDTAVTVDQNTLPTIYSPACFDHLLIYTLPYYTTNYSILSQDILDAIALVDPTFDAIPLDSTLINAQERLTQYITAAYTYANVNMFERLRNHQLLIPVIETIKISTDDESKAPSAQCIETAANISLIEIQYYSDDVENNTIMYYRWGNPTEEPIGLNERAVSNWDVAVRAANQYAKQLNEEQVDNHEACRLASLILNIR